MWRGVLLILLLSSLLVARPITAAEPIIVTPDGDYASLVDAIQAAEAGAVIEVHGGTYPALVIDKPVMLIGVDHPVIDGAGTGNVVHITAPDVTLQGFTIRNSGSAIHHEDAGILVEAQRATLAENRLENVLFGIKLMNAADSIARNNWIEGQDRDMGIRGDSITVWYSHHVQLIGNTSTRTRDMLVSYADHLLIQGNTIRDSRYGLHFMYSNFAQVRDNTLEHNSVGAFLMYSHDLTLERNIFAYNRGASGYGLALKDMDNVTASDNLFVGNTMGLYLDNSPSQYEGINLFRSNVFTYNDVGIAALPAVERNTFTENILLKNIQQVGIQGREVTSRNTWTANGRGNYWSDYTGYDADGDGIGDLSYKADKLFETLASEYPAVELLSFSPAAQAIEFTAAAFPIFRPVPRVIDEAPLITYSLPAVMTPAEHQVNTRFLGLSLLLLGCPLLLIALSQLYPSVAATPRLPVKEGHMITVENLTKKYGKSIILQNVSFQVRPGEAVALWGTNGAGKTTTLKCLLGVQPFEGRIVVNGVEVRQDGKKARALLGYVPQEVAFYDLSLEETLKFHARLKHVKPNTLPAILEQVGLSEHRRKPVRTLSGGMKQRLALAIGLIGNPPILLLDESTANLDSQVRREFIQLIQQLKQAGKTIIFCSHHFDEVTALADRVLVLRGNHLEADVTPHHLVERLGWQQWLRVFVPGTMNESAMSLLSQHGYQPVMNSRAFYVPVSAENRMLPLRLLEAAEIPVQNFDIVDHLSGEHYAG